MKRILALCLTACLLCALFAGCATEDAPYAPTGNALDSNTLATTPPDKEEQELTLIYYPDRSLNPYTATDYTNRVLISLLYQGLFSVDRDYRVEPVLCQSYRVSPDMKTYTFYLNKAWFADGTAVTAQDVVKSLSAARYGTYYAGRFQHIESVYASEDAVVIELDTPFENLPLLLDIPIVKASEVTAEVPLGTGPYLWEELATGVRLRRQAAWWCKVPCVATAPTIALKEAESINQIRDSFEFGNLDLVCADPGADIYADYRCDYEIWDCDTGIFLYLVCHTDSWLFHDDSLRQALTHAMNRSALVEEFYRGFATAATLPADPDAPGYNQALANRYRYDSEAFAAAIANAEVPEDETAVLAVNANDTLRVRVARRIAEDLGQYGLNVRVEEVPSDEFAEYLEEGKFDLYLGQTKLSPNMDLSAFFAEEGALSYGGLTDAALYAMNQEALANSGNRYNLHEQIMEEGNLIPLLFRSYAIYATRGVLTDLTPARDHIFYYSTGRSLADALITE